MCLRVCVCVWNVLPSAALFLGVAAKRLDVYVKDYVCLFIAPMILLRFHSHSIVPIITNY